MLLKRYLSLEQAFKDKLHSEQERLRFKSINEDLASINQKSISLDDLTLTVFPQLKIGESSSILTSLQ